MGQRLTLSVLEGSFGVCRLDRDAAVPARILALDFFCVTRTREELSIVASEEALSREELPSETRVEDGWACLKVEGPLEFSMVGVLAELSGTLAEAGISIFAVSTYDTDYLLVKNEDLASTVQALSGAGHLIRRA